MKRLLIYIMMMMPLMANADAVEINGIYYNLISKNNAAEVTSNPDKYKGTVEIPPSVTYGGITYSVTTIGENAFSYCTGMTSISIPNSVTSINYAAFRSCSGLNTITLPNSITSIGNAAFQGCSSFTSVTIPNGITSIGEFVFGGCEGLTSVTIPNSVTTLEWSAFSGCTSLSTFDIPNNVEYIRSCVFENCTGLTTITIPDGVTFIGGGAFRNCTSLTTVTIPSSVKSIKEEAFAKCKSLMDVYCLAESVPSTNGNAFSESYQESISLHVPAKSIDSYRAKEPWSKFYEIVAIEGVVEPESPKCATPEIKFSNDTFTFSCATQGVEFVSVVTVGDAKKYYEAKIKLAQTYKISVYATKNGYERSDIATKGIVITDDNTGSAEVLIGDVDGNGIVNVADHVELSKIIQEQGQ